MIERLQRALDTFVAYHAARGYTQRGADWANGMATTVGGSEIAALMGHSRSGFSEVVQSKVRALRKRPSPMMGPPCWWGSLLEDVSAAYIAIDLGAPVVGDEICIRRVPGHRTSPDGYVVGRFFYGGDGQLHLWTTDMDPTIPTVALVLMIEIKCPISREPKAGAVPPQYRPQVWSGLAVSPIAHRGIFVDTVFRRCSLGDLGDTPVYDAAYHPRSAERDALEPRLPVAWGLIAVYAPRLEAPRHVRLGWAGPEWAPGDPDDESDAAQIAWRIHAAASVPGEPADLGEIEPRIFDQVLGLIDRRRFRVLRDAPMLSDGRGGSRLHKGYDAALAELDALAPADHWLMGILPWKLMSVDYVFVDRRPGFLAEIAPLIAEVHATAAAAVASSDATAFISAAASERTTRLGGTSRQSFGARPSSRTVDEADVQDLFDAIGECAGTR